MALVLEVQYITTVLNIFVFLVTFQFLGYSCLLHDLMENLAENLQSIFVGDPSAALTGAARCMVLMIRASIFDGIPTVYIHACIEMGV